MYSVRSRPARSRRWIACGSAYPSYMGTVWLTPSPQSSTMPVVRPEAYSESTAWMATYIAGALNVSNMICVIFSRLTFGFSGASVSSTGCSCSIRARQSYPLLLGALMPAELLLSMVHAARAGTRQDVSTCTSCAACNTDLRMRWSERVYAFLTTEPRWLRGQIAKYQGRAAMNAKRCAGYARVAIKLERTSGATRSSL